MTKLREFNKFDWIAYSGAEDTPGKPPMIREEKAWVGVCDINGVGVSCDDDTDDLGVSEWFLAIPEHKYGLSKFILESLPEFVDRNLLDELGFV